MKLSNLFWGLLGVMAFSACSSDEITPETDSLEMNGQDRFLSVQIANTTAVTRTRADHNQTLGEGDSTYEEGLDAENAVNKVRFYFFDANKNACPVKHDGTNFFDCTLNSEGKDMPNIEEKLEAVIVISTKEGDNADNLKSMVALINHEGLNLGSESLSLSALRDKVADYSSTTNGFLMTSSVFGSESDDFFCEVEIPGSALKKSETEAKENPVDVYVERVLAKVRLHTEWSNEMTKIEDVSYNGKKYTAVKLKTAKGADGKDVTVVEGNDEKDVYVIFTGWEVTGTANVSYLFKQVNSDWTFTPNWAWNHPIYHRSYWALNPTSDQGFKLQYNKTYKDITAQIGTAGVTTSSPSYDGSELYCQENAADNADGTKFIYDPEQAVSNYTQAVIAAVLVTVDETTKEARPVDLAKWVGKDYTKEGVLNAMLGTVDTQIYIATTNDEGEDLSYRKIGADDVELVSGEAAGEADDESEDSKRYLSYLKLKESSHGFDFRNGGDHKTKYDFAKVNEILATAPGAKVWQSGQTYYYTNIQHLNQNDKTGTNGQYGVVRNHIYEIAINSVYGLGTPVLDPDEVLVPQHPKEDETYLAAQINILSWRVVKQNVDLEW